MKKTVLSLIVPLCFTLTQGAFAETVKTETIVFLRHAEKPKIEIGQLNCKGLNRALKLPTVLVHKFGKPNAIFAPNPSRKIEKNGKSYSYLRPLITIEPTAIQMNLPVNAQYGYKEIKKIGTELLDKKFENSTIFVAWEHFKLVDITKFVTSQIGGNSKNIPSWNNSDFDSIYILKITTNSDEKKTVVFSQDTEGLNGQSEACPSF